MGVLVSLSFYYYVYTQRHCINKFVACLSFCKHTAMLAAAGFMAQVRPINGCDNVLCVEFVDL